MRQSPCCIRIIYSGPSMNQKGANDGYNNVTSINKTTFGLLVRFFNFFSPNRNDTDKKMFSNPEKAISGTSSVFADLNLK